MRQKKSQHGILRRRRKTLLITASIIVLVLLFDLSPLGGTIKFYSTWISCGQEPVVTVGSGYFNAHAPSYYLPPKANIFPGAQQYFCTAFDAEKHGYSADPDQYEFPVLEQNNALCKKPTDPVSETAAMFTPCDEE